jgi:glucosamine-6-phosphate deaminase
VHYKSCKQKPCLGPGDAGQLKDLNMREKQADKLKVKIYDTRNEMGAHAASLVAANIRGLLTEKENVNIIFAAAASQNEFLSALIQEDIDWTRVNAFHMDEYIGLPAGADQLFGKFLDERIFLKVPFRKVYYINGQAEDPEAECERYTRLLKEFPVDITCMGIGENAHIAFNDPHVAEFNDAKTVKVVDLDEPCKVQQVREGCFESTDQVPPIAFTLTIPALLRAPSIYCMVPGAPKADAVYHTIHSAITEKYPSTILRTHNDAILFLEKQSAARIDAELKMQLEKN